MSALVCLVLHFWVFYSETEIIGSGSRKEKHHCLYHYPHRAPADRLPQPPEH